VGDNGTERDVQQPPYKNAAIPETTTGNGHAKFTLFEGGVRDPLFITGPDVASGGRTNNTVVDVVDLFQTIQELAGVNVAATLPTNVIIDSKSIVPALKEDVVVPQSYLLGEQFNQSAATDGFTLRNNKYKLIHWYNTSTERLYDLENDPYEFTNLLASPLTAEAQSNLYALKIQSAQYLTLPTADNTRNLLPAPAINSQVYSNSAFSVNAQVTELSTNVFVANPNQPGLTRLKNGGTNLNYNVILWRSSDLSNPLSWAPVATNLVTGITNSFQISTNGVLTDSTASADHNYYRITPYYGYP
jgi:hypothetical protein